MPLRVQKAEPDDKIKMIAYIKGILKSRTPDKAVIDNSGIGDEININSLTYNDLPGHPEQVVLYTHLYVREDKQELYGFLTSGEKKFFEILLGTSNIGPGKAMSILSQISPSQFASAIAKRDVTLLSSIKGIGKKTAEKIVLELKDKLGDFGVYEQDFKVERSRIEDALGGLVSLGFRENAAREMINSVRDELNREDRAEDIIRKALKKHA
jgi:Holliday junction DNA helicase RuvA